MNAKINSKRKFVSLQYLKGTQTTYFNISVHNRNQKSMAPIIVFHHETKKFAFF